MESFRSMLHDFSLMSLTSELCSLTFWYGLKDLFTLHKLVDKVILTSKTDDVTSSRKDVDSHGAVMGGSVVNGLISLKSGFFLQTVNNYYYCTYSEKFYQMPLMKAEVSTKCTLFLIISN